MEGLHFHDLRHTPATGGRPSRARPSGYLADGTELAKINGANPLGGRYYGAAAVRDAGGGLKWLVSTTPYMAHLALDSVTTATIRGWRRKLLDDGRPEVQAAKAYRVLRAIFNTAVREDEILKANPCRIKGFDAYHSPERPVPTIDQLEALVELMPARYHALIILAGFAACAVASWRP